MSNRTSAKRFRDMEGSPWTIACGLSYAGVALFADSVFRTGITTRAGFREGLVAYLLDLTDGPTARLMGQATERGAATDATADKIKKAMAVSTGLRESFLPPAAAAGIVAVNMSNVIATDRFENAYPDQKFTASWPGKIGEFFQNVGYFSYAYGEVIAQEAPEQRDSLRLAGHMLVSVGLAISSVASYGYHQRAEMAPTPVTLHDETSAIHA